MESKFRLVTGFNSFIHLHINYLKEVEVNPAYKKQIKIYLNPGLCTECFINRSRTINRMIVDLEW